MAKNKVTSNGKKNQAAMKKQQIKHFHSGVVSWSLFSDFQEKIFTFEGRLSFLCRAAFCFGELNDFSLGMDLIENQLEQFGKTHKDFRQRALSECNEAGGNYVSTVRDTSERKFEAEELIKHLSGHVEKAEKELQEIDA